MNNFSIDFESIKQNQKGLFKICIKLAYFNPMICRWEPVIESTGF